ncbi:AtaL-like protein [Flavobacterium sp.]|uniref:AtaL-like protein n=1 Tax=Flavobacterium sp. TaxID=239 RepID=UPI002B4B6CB4|nr:AtaL-like protein [Flavobacterium sp.]HLP65769.1 AtaL-like protein [Flavobacterium sp.]
MTSFSTSVNASLENVWKHLNFKIEHPEAFVPGVSSVTILDKNEEFVIRQMNITINGTTSKVVEKITSVPFCVRFELLEHPKFTGYVDNEAIAISENETQVTYTMNWVDKQTQIAYENPEIMKNAVLKTKEHIESNL